MVFPKARPFSRLCMRSNCPRSREIRRFRRGTRHGVPMPHEAASAAMASFAFSQKLTGAEDLKRLFWKTLKTQFWKTRRKTQCPYPEIF